MNEGFLYHSFITEDCDKGLRVDKFLADNLSELSRNYILKLISEGRVTVNGAVVKPSKRIEPGDEIQLLEPEPEPVDIKPLDRPLEVLYEDDDLIVVNKPKGLVVHPANGHYDDTLVNILMHTHGGQLSGINGQLRPGIVHRLDMDTSGSLIVCKNDETHREIARQIAVHSINRIYVGIVHGNVKEDGRVNAPIGRSSSDRKKMAVNTGRGKPAITDYHVLQPLSGYTYMQFKLETGRTHQIRVHMSHIGHPILGDAVYGPKKCPYKLQGQTLHAKIIGFRHPRTGEYIEIEAPVPEYINELLRKLSV